jgi:hypothetical protein
MAISGKELYAVCLAATPNDLAWLALRMIRHKRQSELVPDIDRSICHDPGAARRDVHDEAFALRHPVVDRNPGRLFGQLPSRFALYLCPRLIDSHDDHPWNLTAIGQAIARTGHQIEGDSVKFLLAHCLEIYRFTSAEMSAGPSQPRQKIQASDIGGRHGPYGDIRQRCGLMVHA